MTTCFVLAFAMTFNQAPAPPVEFDSVVELLPDRPRCAASDPRTTAWLVAYSLALRIDNRGHQLAKPDIDPATAARLRLQNLADVRLMLRALELLLEMESELPPLSAER